MKLNLIGNERDRQYAINQGYKTKGKLINMLKKFGQVNGLMPEQMVADYFGVSTKTIHHYGDRNKEELSKYGYKVYSKSEIEKNLKPQVGALEKIPNRGLRLYTAEALAVIGMMLTESKVAEELREEIISELFGNPYERIDVLEEKVDNAICIKKKQSMRIVDAMKLHLGIKTKKEAPEEYQMLSMLITAHFQVVKFEDIPVSKNSVIELKKCFDIFDEMYKEQPKQIGWNV